MISILHRGKAWRQNIPLSPINGIIVFTNPFLPTMKTLNPTSGIVILISRSKYQFVASKPIMLKIPHHQGRAYLPNIHTSTTVDFANQHNYSHTMVLMLFAGITRQISHQRQKYSRGVSYLHPRRKKYKVTVLHYMIGPLLPQILSHCLPNPENLHGMLPQVFLQATLGTLLDQLWHLMLYQKKKKIWIWIPLPSPTTGVSSHTRPGVTIGQGLDQLLVMQPERRGSRKWR